jgi:hypothetical protein
LKLSARNQLAGTVSSINKGAAIANVVLDVGGQRLRRDHRHRRDVIPDRRAVR